MINDHDQELLESYLDGELSTSHAEALHSRLTADIVLASELETLQRERDLRRSLFKLLEGNETTAGKLLSSLPSQSIRRFQNRRIIYGTAAAACIALSFFAGWISSVGKSSTAGANPSNFTVEIRDQAGQIIAVQKFESLEKAREFSDDLDQWQQRQQQLMNGQVTIHSASF